MLYIIIFLIYLKFLLKVRIFVLWKSHLTVVYIFTNERVLYNYKNTEAHGIYFKCESLVRINYVFTFQLQHIQRENQ